jgi:hypothetical protein
MLSDFGLVVFPSFLLAQSVLRRPIPMLLVLAPCTKQNIPCHQDGVGRALLKAMRDTMILRVGLDAIFVHLLGDIQIDCWKICG